MTSIEIRAVQKKEDCHAIVELTQICFPEEARATGLPPKQWRDIHTDELLRNPSLWEQCGIALQNDKIVGAVVLTVEDEPDAALSYWEVSRRAGCIPTLLTMCYDQVLEEPLEPHECLIDFLAVSTEARGKGVGAALIRWAERSAAEILFRRVPEGVKDHGVLMTLWVAADNSAATSLYEKNGYSVVRKTNERFLACCSSFIFQQFLGHAVWWKMQKQLAVSDIIKSSSDTAYSVPVGKLIKKKGGGERKMQHQSKENIRLVATSVVQHGKQ